ncbi:2,3-bisphosphoglycerate-independent phosphoglycerate mutase [Candidatus Pacearchaeota archaeon]|nr:2,3-bisphosphoglycerate-independent phosphoglycerate mutase [Candidatus Pacearchaeota archaeon]
MKKILIIFDGAADLPLDVFNGKTAFESAYTPNLDFFAREGKLGYMYALDEKTIPGSDNALACIFGSDSEIKRGIIEAIGAGIKLNKGDVAFRTNFVTIDNLKNRNVVDRRAGRNITTKEANELASVLNEKIKLKCNFIFKNTVQHRGVLVLRNNKLSSNITNIDNEWLKPGEKYDKFSFSFPLDKSEESQNTANIVNDFVNQAFFILNNHIINKERVKKGFFPANMIFLRGAGDKITKLKKYNLWMSINAMPLEVGFAKILGMKNFSYEIPEMSSIDVYEHLYQILDSEISYAIKALQKHYAGFSGCYIHFKETDDPGHDNKPYDKKKMIEIIDKNFFGFLKSFSRKHPIKIVVTCDHATPCKNKGHSADPVPVLVYGEGRDNCSRFTESEARKGSLGKIYGKDFMRVTGLRK